MTFEISNHFKKPPLWAYLVAYAIPYLSLAAIALYWPAHSSPWGLDFTQSWWARMIPSVSAYIDKSKFPHATAAYFVLSGLLALPYILLTIWFPRLGHITLAKALLNYKKYKNHRLRAWILVPFVTVWYFWIMWIQPGYQFGIAPIRDQRWALATIGIWFSFYFIALWWVTIVANMVYFENIFQLERKHHGME